MTLKQLFIFLDEYSYMGIIIKIAIPQQRLLKKIPAANILY